MHIWMQNCMLDTICYIFMKNMECFTCNAEEHPFNLELGTKMIAVGKYVQQVPQIVPQKANSLKVNKTW